jgi:uncharacterized integral membrane protein
VAKVQLPEELSRVPTAKRGRRARSIVPFAVGALVAALAISNRGEVEVDWLITTWRTPLVVLIVVSVLAGMLVGWLLGARRGRH